MREIKKTKKEFNILNKDDRALVTINNKTDDKIMIYDEKIASKVYEERFMNKYQKLLSLTVNVCEDEDATDSDGELVLLKIEELKELLMTRYYKYLSKYQINKYLKMIMMLEERLMLPRKTKSR